MKTFNIGDVIQKKGSSQKLDHTVLMSSMSGEGQPIVLLQGPNSKAWKLSENYELKESYEDVYNMYDMFGMDVQDD